jgi:hypothetical protein
MVPQATSISMSGITHAVNFDPSTHLDVTRSPHAAGPGGGAAGALAWDGTNISSMSNYSKQTAFTYDAFRGRTDWNTTSGMYPAIWSRRGGVINSPTGIDLMEMLHWDLRESNDTNSSGHYIDLRHLYNGQESNADDAIYSINTYFDDAYGNTAFSPAEIFFHYVTEAGF